MAGSHSTVLRLGVDGEFTPAGGWPLQVGMPIHEVLNGATAKEFDQACRAAVETGRTTIFQADVIKPGCEVSITPVLDDHSSVCRYLVCWIRDKRSIDAPNFNDMRPEEIALRWRRRSVGGRLVVEAGPVWLIPGGEPIDLWEHGDRLVAIGLATLVVTTVLHKACEAFVTRGGAGFGLYTALPFGGLLAGIVPTVIGTLRSTGLAADRLTLSVPVAVAVEEHRRSTLMHLQALGLRLEVQGSGQLAKSLFGLDDRYAADAVQATPSEGLLGPWAPAIGQALVLVQSPVG